MTDTLAPPPAATDAPVVLSPSAARRINAVLAKQADDSLSGLRVSVIGGGCSGFQYTFALDAAPAEGDLVLEKDGAKVFIDDVSQGFLNGSVIDFVDDLMGQAFQIKNPNAVAACGCGTSFSI